jgi:hypothetical protein
VKDGDVVEASGMPEAEDDATRDRSNGQGETEKPCPDLIGPVLVVSSACLVLIVVFALIGVVAGRGGSSDNLQIRLGLEDLGRSYERATIGAACISAGHRWENDRCRYAEK